MKTHSKSQHLFELNKWTAPAGRFILSFVVLFILSSINNQIKASHAVGGEITYSADTQPNRYKIVMTIYRDCNGINLGTSTTVQVQRITGGFNQSVNLTRTSVTDISLICPGQVSSCNGGSGAFGTERHVYEGTVILPPGFSYRVSNTLCCRPNAITTMQNPGNEALYLETTINTNLGTANNSPVFLNPPIAVFCAQQAASVSLGATDPDGDSLVYSLINAREGLNNPVEYAAPYSGTNPVSSIAPAVMNPITGQISFTPNSLQVAVIAVLVEEYRNGVKIGEISRDLQIRVVNCNSNTTPTIAAVANATVNVGQQICIPIVANDADGDILSLNVSSGITPAPSFVIDSQVAGATYGTFCYTPIINDSNKTFTISISVNDDYCPIPSSAASSFNINVLLPCNVTNTISSTDALCGDPVGTATANAGGGTAPYSFSWSGNGYSGNTQTLSGLIPGTYYVTITDAYNCSASDSVEILRSGSIISLSASSNGATCGLSNGTITAIAGNGIPPYSYSLNNGPSQLGDTFIGLAPGNYNLTVSDVTTCATTISVTVDDIIDIIPPVAVCKDYALTLSNGTGTVQPADIDNGSSDNCGITSMTVLPNTFNCSNEGVNTVLLIVQDAQGNADTCSANVTIQAQPSCSIVAVPANNTYTGGISTNIFLGYGPQSATLSATASGGSSFTYSWSPALYLDNPNVQNPVFTPLAAGTYTYTLTVTNEQGCSSTCDITFCVVDAVVPGNKGKSSGKVYLCHVPPGNSGNSHILAVSTNAVAAHLMNHSGDQLGACGPLCATGNKSEGNNGLSVIEIPEDGMTYKVYPNPANDYFNLYVASLSDDKVDAVIYDMTGRVMFELNNIELFSTVSFGENFSPGMYMINVIQGENKKSMRILKMK